MSEFQKLLTDLDALHKAMPKGKSDDDDEIRAAADGDADDDGEEDGDEDSYTGEPDGDEDGEDEDNDGDGEPMGKSFPVTLADGTEVEALDATELLKAMQDDAANQFGQVGRVLSGTMGLLKSMNAELASLRKEVARMGARGAGRQSVLRVPPEQAEDMAKSDRSGPNDILAKSMAAMHRGDFNAAQVAEVEVYVSRGMPLPAHLARIVAQ
jgi:hypothetical protein